MLKVNIPNICTNEQHYALDILLQEFLGLPFETEAYEGDVMLISKLGFEGKLTLDTSFFKLAHHAWLKPETMPELPLKSWSLSEDNLNAEIVEEAVPVLYGQPGLSIEGNHWHLNLDIFGSVFFMLSRYEELITPDRDDHERLPATASIAYKANFLDRPIVNEYLEILWKCMHALWPDLKRRKRTFRKLISCDVDHPFDLAGYSLKRTVLRIGARIVRDKNLKLALIDGLNYLFKKFGSDRFDEFRNNIYWMMEVNKQSGNKVSFYFIPIQTDSKREEPNNINAKNISCLLKRIVDSGHEVGFHPGYMTYKYPENFKKSADALKEACINQNISVSSLGGRQHYLRFDIGKTPRLWQENGFTYDSTLGFADRAGFRSGVCYEYSMFDLLRRKKMSFMQRPLIAMDCTIISEGYEGLGFSQRSLDRLTFLKETCKKFDGDFTLLWHNSFFQNANSKLIYISIISDYKVSKSRVNF